MATSGNAAETRLPSSTVRAGSGDDQASTTANRGNFVFPALFFLAPLATSVAPRLTPFFIAIIGLSVIGTALRRGASWQDLLPRQPAFAACLTFGAYVLLNATWSADFQSGLGKAALLMGLIVISFAAGGAATRLDRETLRRTGLAFAAGSFLGATFLVFEFYTDGLATRTAMNWVTLLQSTSAKHVKLSTTGEVLALNLSKLDQNVNLALFHLWPGLLALMALGARWRIPAMVFFFVAIAAAVAFSEHDSSKVALVGSALVVALAWMRRRDIARALAVLWCGAFVLVLPASFLAYQGDLHFAEWLPSSARARVILWEFTAEQTLNRPLLGVGVEATPKLSEQQKAKFAREQPEGFIFPRTMGHHAHNFFLQTWYELGAVGALLLTIAGAAVVLLILRLPPVAQPFAAGAFITFALVGAFAWGMWQSWFMSAVALLPIYLRVAAASARPDG